MQMKTPSAGKGANAFNTSRHFSNIRTPHRSLTPALLPILPTPEPRTVRPVASLPASTNLPAMRTHSVPPYVLYVLAHSRRRQACPSACLLALLAMLAVSLRAGRVLRAACSVLLVRARSVLRSERVLLHALLALAEEALEVCSVDGQRSLAPQHAVVVAHLCHRLGVRLRGSGGLGVGGGG
jgi:hypothetical protein